MKHNLTCWLLFLCVQFFFGNPADPIHESSHDIQRWETDSKPAKVVIGMTISPGWNVTLGDTIVINCTTNEPENDHKMTLQLVWTKLGLGDKTKKILVNQPASKGISYVLGPIIHEHMGVYTCEDDGSVPNIDVTNRHHLIWVVDPSPAVTMGILSVNNVNFFLEKAVAIGCQLPDSQSQWKIMRFDMDTGNITECANQETSGHLLACTIKSQVVFSSIVGENKTYWCESAGGDRSNILEYTKAVNENWRKNELLGAKIKVRPAQYLSVGDSVEITCNLSDGSRNVSNHVKLQLVWTKIGYKENIMKVLSSQPASTGISYRLGPVTHEHQGVYSCFGNGSLPVNVIPQHTTIWVADDSPAVTMDVLSHRRTHFFHAEVVTLGCQLPDDQSEWKIKWACDFYGKVEDCATLNLSSNRLLTCTIKTGAPWSNQLYWCESATGEKSNVLNITTTMFSLIVEAPTLPVLEGDDLTLRCLYRNTTTKEITSNFKTSFYKFFTRVRAESHIQGTITLKAVTKADEGRYVCFHPEARGSEEIWITVKARPENKK